MVSILDKIEFQKKFGTSPSVYVSGCKGSGKTCVLNLLARSLKKDGYNVYFFEPAVAFHDWRVSGSNPC